VFGTQRQIHDTCIISTAVDKKVGLGDEATQRSEIIKPAIYYQIYLAEGISFI